MKNNRSFYILLLVVSLMYFFFSCKKEDTPVTPSGFGTVTDIDGNVYKTVTIGTQTWMAENLKVTKYRNGNLIPNVTNDASWKALITGAYCWYNNDAANKTTYGALYNWYAVVDSRNLAPTGWHVPTYAELTILTDLLGGEGGAGGKMKEVGLAHWLTPNTDATNSSGFTALPGGSRDYYGTCMYFGIGGWWWSSTGWPSYPETSAYYLGMGYNMAGIGSSNNSHSSKYYGFSVRCLRD